jgi:FKBP-type peptidyl-prolyl cis-trans isomerase FkpA
MKLNSPISVFLLAAVLFTACQSADLKKTPTGMPYKLFRSDSKGMEVKEGYVFKAHFKQLIDDSVLFDSRESNMPIYVKATKGQATYDITELFLDLRKGDSIFTSQMVDTFLKRNPGQLPPFLKAGSVLHFALKVLDVFESDSLAQVDEANEKAQIVKNEAETLAGYIAKNKINAVKTEDGVFVETLLNGNGPVVEKGKYISVMYTGTSISGVKFDSNVDPSFGHTEPLGFTVGVGEMIKGFDLGVLNLKQGSKVKLYIPSMLAYADRPQSDKIKPYEALIFEIEIKSVLDKAPATPQNN